MNGSSKISKSFVTTHGKNDQRNETHHDGIEKITHVFIIGLSSDAEIFNAVDIPVYEIRHCKQE
jgi:hypothetical protein